MKITTVLNGACLLNLPCFELYNFNGSPPLHVVALTPSMWILWYYRRKWSPWKVENHTSRLLSV